MASRQSRTQPKPTAAPSTSASPSAFPSVANPFPGAPFAVDMQALMADPAAWARMLSESMEKFGTMGMNGMSSMGGNGAGSFTPNFAPNFGAFNAGAQPLDMKQMLEGLNLRIDPTRLLELQNNYTRSLATLWRDMVEGRPHEPPKDRRFGAPDWSGMHAYMAEVYLLNSRFISDLADSVEADAKAKAKLQFATQQLIDAMSPANYLATNPEALHKIIETEGKSLQTGMMNMLADLQKGRISQSDETAFEIGRNVGTTEGSVVFQNEIIQLIHYTPLSANIYERPLLIVPPCINKFYILDLQPESSLVRYALEQGHNVFLISWRNPAQEQAHLTWDDYVEEGAIRGIEIARAISKQKTINVLGFCIGGTVIATALAVLAARGEQPAASLTLLTTFLDFAETGILDVFVDEAMVHQQEVSMGGLTPEGTPGGPCGLLPARDLSAMFSSLRPNELVWNYVVSNYLKGQTPMAFDLLYWNGDGTNIPGPFLSWYLRNTYLENNLKVPGKVSICGQPVDFGKIAAPTYIYSSREDHIVPWTSAYASTALLKGPNRFVVGASGHIAGVINPPAKKKRSYWVHPVNKGAKPIKFPTDPQVWFSKADEIPGSWWPDWSDWLSTHAGKKIKAPSKVGNAQYQPIEAAPGSFVKVRTM